MTLGVRGKLFVVSLLLMLAVGLGSGVYLQQALKSWLDARVEAELFRHARTARALLEMVGASESIAAMDPIADRLGDTTGARVTIIAANGTVLGDSELQTAQIEKIENHSERPELRAALARGRGLSRRYSTTLRADMLYVAVPYKTLGRRGCVRVAMPLSEVDQAIAKLRLVLLIAGLVGLVLAVFLSGLASQLATRAIRGLVVSARRVAKGEGARRLSVESSDELGRLAGSFNNVVEELDRTVAVLAAERDHLETILDSMSEGVLALDSTQRIARANRAAVELLKLPSTPTGQALLETIRVPALVDLASADPVKPDITAEFELQGTRHVQAHAAPLRTGGCVVVMRDISRTRRLEAIRRDFVANVSHELRTPVSVIRANAETLADGVMERDPERARIFLRAVCGNADRLAQIIADLLDLSRIEAGEYDLDLGRVELTPVARRVVDSLQGPARLKNLAIELEISADTCAHADAHALEQVFLNLLDNAVKYSHEGGQVKLRAMPADAWVRIEVEDEGPGIEPRHRARVFERFYRVDPGRSREMGGTGLGLAIVKHLVETMGGEVGFEPRSPQGSIFWFALPCAR